MSAEVLERSYSFEHPEKRLPNNQPILCFHKFHSRESIGSLAHF
jgi:hypothetical protein